MFKHEKQFLNPVRVDRPNPNYAPCSRSGWDVLRES